MENLSATDSKRKTARIARRLILKLLLQPTAERDVPSVELPV